MTTATEMRERRPPKAQAITRDLALVEAGRKLVGSISRNRMKLGRLALEYAPMGERGVQTAEYDRLAEYAEAIGIALGTLRNYRTVAHAWRGTGVRDGEFPFDMLYQLMAAEDKRNLLETLRHNSGFTTAEAVSAAHKLGHLSAVPSPRKPRKPSPRPGRRLKAALESLRLASFEDAKGWQTDRYAEVLDEIRAEVDRLNRELRR